MAGTAWTVGCQTADGADSCRRSVVRELVSFSFQNGMQAAHGSVDERVPNCRASDGAEAVGEHVSFCTKFCSCCAAYMTLYKPRWERAA